MAGYANRVVVLDFPDLSEDPVNDPIRVVVRNPKLMPPQELIPKDDVELVEGQPVDPQAAMRSGYEIVAKLLIGWRVYDPTAPIGLDVDLNPVGDQPLLPQEFTPENVAKLPAVILNRLGDLVQEAVNPQ
jgi:hypothetical protein